MDSANDGSRSRKLHSTQVACGRLVRRRSSSPASFSSPIHRFESTRRQIAMRFRADKHDDTDPFIHPFAPTSTERKETRTSEDTPIDQQGDDASLASIGARVMAHFQCTPIRSSQMRA